jgi:hypothetical protein
MIYVRKFIKNENTPRTIKGDACLLSFSSRTGSAITLQRKIHKQLKSSITRKYNAPVEAKCKERK